MGMKFRCERDSLLEALTIAVRATATGAAATRAALAGVHFELAGEVLTLTGSDLDLTLSVTTSAFSGVDGAAVAPGKLLADIVRAVPPGTVEFEITEGEAAITAGSWSGSLRLLPVDDYPQLPFIAESSADGSETPGAFNPAVTFTGPEFRSALSQVVKSASNDDSRPILTGVLMTAEGEGLLRLVSTDSYRLSVRDLEGSSMLGEDQKVLVPGRALSELQKLIDDGQEVTLQLAEQFAQFAVGDVRLTTRLISGEFPNYHGLIPSNQPNQLTVEREPLLEVVKRVKLLAQDSTPVRLAMSSEGLEVSAITQDVGKAQESMPAEYEGEDLTVAFNPGYLTDGIEAATGEEITLETSDAVKPALLRSAGDEHFLYLLMPVRVS